MRALLMFADRDFQVARDKEPGEQDLIQDLEIVTLLKAMAHGDQVIFASAETALLSGLRSIEEIRYRQSVYTDCLNQPAVIRELYELAVLAVAEKKRSWRGIGICSRSGEPLLKASIEELEMFVSILRRLRKLTEDHAAQFSSEGFTRFFATLQRELDDAYFEEIAQHLRRLRFRDGVLASAQLGEGNQGVGYVLRAPRPRGNLLRHPMVKHPSFSRTISREDEAGLRDLGELRSRVVSLAANALAQAADHIGSFFTALRAELGFYLGCLNLHELLAAQGEPDCLPGPHPLGAASCSARGLYDPCLALQSGAAVQGNDLCADGKSLVILTGANQGGKSTFLRSLGLAQLMMQAGMAVAAESFSAGIVEGVLTHFSREEDATMTSGKLDEELKRMSEIGKRISPRSLLLCNESFAATNEREASAIATEVIRAMLHAGISVVFVTHLFELSHHFYEHRRETTLFLRAQRSGDGRRPFQIIEAEPLPSSYSRDLYVRTFGIGSSVPADDTHPLDARVPVSAPDRSGAPAGGAL